MLCENPTKTYKFTWDKKRKTALKRIKMAVAQGKSSKYIFEFIH
jgi:hypothetical protein